MSNEHPESLLHRGLIRDLPSGRSAEPPAETRRQHHGRGLEQHGFEDPLKFESYKDRWMSLLKDVHEDYPYCTMYGSISSTARLLP